MQMRSVVVRACRPRRNQGRKDDRTNPLGAPNVLNTDTPTSVSLSDALKDRLAKSLGRVGESRNDNRDSLVNKKNNELKTL